MSAESDLWALADLLQRNDGVLEREVAARVVAVATSFREEAREEAEKTVYRVLKDLRVPPFDEE